MRTEVHFVSVIIPTFNCEASILKTVDSVLKQTASAYEIIVIDDGSTDDTKKVLDPYIKADKIRYYYQDNKGQGAARNLGAKQARGNWLAFLDADDEWLPNFLEVQAKQIKRFPDSKLFFTNSAYYDRDTFLWNHYPKTSYFSGKAYPNLLKNNFIVNSSVVINKSVFSDLGMFSESKHLREVEDYDLWLRLSKQYSIQGSNLVCVKYHLNYDKSKNVKHRKHVSKGLALIMFKNLLPVNGSHKLLVFNRLLDNLKQYFSI